MFCRTAAGFRYFTRPPDQKQQQRSAETTRLGHFCRKNKQNNDVLWSEKTETTSNYEGKTEERSLNPVKWGQDKLSRIQRGEEQARTVWLQTSWSGAELSEICYRQSERLPFYFLKLRPHVTITTSSRATENSQSHAHLRETCVGALPGKNGLNLLINIRIINRLPPSPRSDVFFNYHYQTVVTFLPCSPPPYVSDAKCFCPTVIHSFTVTVIIWIAAVLCLWIYIVL